MVIPKFPVNLVFIKMYVNDIILALPQDGIGSTVVHINNNDQHIQFDITVRLSFRKIKDKTNLSSKSNIIYEISYQNSEKRYIGHTPR